MTTENKTPHRIAVPYHSDLHKIIAEWLRENRHLPQPERIEKAAFMLCNHPDTDKGLILHYAASCFCLMDEMTVHHEEKLPAIIAEGTAKQLQIFGKYEFDRKTQSGQNANKARRDKFETIEQALKQYWLDNIDRNKRATDAAILLEKTDIFRQSSAEIKRSTLEGYVRKWQKEN